MQMGQPCECLQELQPSIGIPRLLPRAMDEQQVNENMKEFASSFNRELSDEEMNLDITWGKIGAILQSATRII